LTTPPKREHAAAVDALETNYAQFGEPCITRCTKKKFRVCTLKGVPEQWQLYPVRQS